MVILYKKIVKKNNRQMKVDPKSLAIQLAKEKTVGRSILLEKIKNTEKKIKDLENDIGYFEKIIQETETYIRMYDLQRKKNIKLIKSKKGKLEKSKKRIDNKNIIISKYRNDIKNYQQMLLPNNVYADQSIRISAISLRNKCKACRFFNHKIFNCKGIMHQVISVHLKWDNDHYIPEECQEGGIYCSMKNKCIYIKCLEFKY